MLGCMILIMCIMVLITFALLDEMLIAGTVTCFIIWGGFTCLHDSYKLEKRYAESTEALQASHKVNKELKLVIENLVHDAQDTKKVYEAEVQALDSAAREYKLLYTSCKESTETTQGTIESIQDILRN